MYSHKNTRTHTICKLTHTFHILTHTYHVQTHAHTHDIERHTHVPYTNLHTTHTCTTYKLTHYTYTYVPYTNSQTHVQHRNTNTHVPYTHTPHTRVPHINTPYIHTYYEFTHTHVPNTNSHTNTHTLCGLGREGWGRLTGVVGDVSARVPSSLLGRGPLSRTVGLPTTSSSSSAVLHRPQFLPVPLLTGRPAVTGGRVLSGLTKSRFVALSIRV